MLHQAIAKVLQEPNVRSSAGCFLGTKGRSIASDQYCCDERSSEDAVGFEVGVVGKRCAAALAVVGVLGLTAACGTDRLVGQVPDGSGGAGNPLSSTTPAAGSSSSSGGVDDFSCPPVPGRGETPAPVTGPKELPAGAVAVRICDSGGLFGAAPLDALTAGVPKVVDSVNALPVAARCDAMPMDLGPTWDLVFLYSDGHTQTVRGSTHGCGGVDVGSVVRGGREDADLPLRLLQRLLWEQRESTPPADVSVAKPGCSDGGQENSLGQTFMPLQEPLSMQHAVLCWRFETESEQPAQQAEIRDADLTLLLDDLNSNRTSKKISEQECVDPDVVHYRIVGVNAWADRLALDGYCGAFDLSGNNSDVWRPNPDSQAILDRLVADHPTAIAAPHQHTAPEQVVAIWADLVNSGNQDRATELWTDPPEIPTGVRIEMKTGQVRSVLADPGTTEAAYHKVVEVSSLYRLVSADGSWVDYHEVRFRLGRERADLPWRILEMTDDGETSNGR